MKVYFTEDILTEFIEDLTPEKRYEVLEHIDGGNGRIIDDVGTTIVIKLKSCAHLCGGSWRVEE